MRRRRFLAAGYRAIASDRLEARAHGATVDRSYPRNPAGVTPAPHLTVEADDQILYLRPKGMRSFGPERDTKLSLEGAAEFYWSMLIERLQ